MKFLGKLILRAQQALKIFKGRYLSQEDDFFLEEHAAATALQTVQEEKNKSLYDFLKETYVDIAESDPEAAIELLKKELETELEPPVEKALIDIEQYIRQTYCSQYFGGMRFKKDN